MRENQQRTAYRQKGFSTCNKQWMSRKATVTNSKKRKKNFPRCYKRQAKSPKDLQGLKNKDNNTKRFANPLNTI